jgi:DNA-directed RNA polymerase specialized sigma24 family protein
MQPDDSVTQWLARLHDEPDDSVAQKRLHDRYWLDLIRFARSRLQGTLRRIGDEEDVALEALSALFRGIRDASFARLDDREDLWQLLAMLVRRRAIDLRRYERTHDHFQQGESALMAKDRADSSAEGMKQVAGDTPSPEEYSQLQEAFRRRLEQLARPEYAQYELQRIAFWKLEARTNDEIAQRLGCATKTVERRLSLIRRIWADVAVG